MIGIGFGLLYANAGEWGLHKYLLHGLGRRKQSFWSFHWHDHHRNVRKNEHIDEHYGRSLFGWNAQSKEALGLVGLGLLHAPLFPVAPFFTGAVWYSTWNYYRVHKRSHEDTAWAREHLPWHYDHHMGPDQDANWCVTRPWFDDLMGTRRPYIGTPRERSDIERKRLRSERRAAKKKMPQKSTGSGTKTKNASEPLSSLAFS